MHMPLNAMGMVGGMNGMGMMHLPGGGMSQPGYGAVGMPGAMAGNMMGGGMGQMGQMGPMGHMGHMGMNPMMGGMGMGMNPMMMQGQGGMNPMMMQGGYGNPNNEAQAGPVSWRCSAMTLSISPSLLVCGPARRKTREGKGNRAASGMESELTSGNAPISLWSPVWGRIR